MTKQLVYLLGFAAGIGILGCSKSGTVEAGATVTGKVTLPDGKPLPGGTIHFRSTTAVHRFGSGDIKGDGTYEAKDVPQGPCIVFVDNVYLKPGNLTAGYVPPPGTRLAGPGEKYVAINPKYTTEATTDLTTTITGSTATYDVELK